MAIKIIRKEGDPALREVAKPVPEVTSNIQKLLTDMTETMYENQGIGLAANQIGILKRCIVADVGEGGPGLIQLVNPVVVHAEGEQFGPEGCLSIPGVTGDVLRAARVTVKGLNRDGEEVEIKTEGLLARCLLHEIDHLNGVLFTDHVRRMGGGGSKSTLPRR